MTRLDHNRAMAQLAAKTGTTVNDITKMTIWGNHSATQYPDLFHAEVGGDNAADAVGDQAWLEGDFIPTVQKRGAAIIEARGASSAASAANAAIDHVRDWVTGTPEGDWVSMAVPSDGSYGVPEGLISSFPCVCEDGGPDRPGPRDRRVLPGAHRRLRRRARRGARRRGRARPDLTLVASGTDAVPCYLRNLRSCCRRAPCRRSGRSGSRPRCRPGTPPTAPRRRTPGTPHPCGGGPRRALRRLTSRSRRSCVERLLRCRRRWRGQATRPVVVELGGHGERRQPGPVADLVGQPPADAGHDALIAEEAVEALGWAASAATRARHRAVSASGPSPVERGLRLGSPATTHTPALRSVPGSVSSRAGRPRTSTGRCRRGAWPTASRRA